MPRTAAAMNSPTSESNVPTGVALLSTTVTSRPRTFIASAISRPM